MKRVIVILEDDIGGRIPAFRRAGADLKESGIEIVIRESAPDFVAWIEAEWERVALVSLDHDLGLPGERGGSPFDPGTGMDVVKILERREASFPVIVHSSNPVAAERMMFGLVDAGWNAFRLPPFGDDWIGTAWARNVKRLLSL